MGALKTSETQANKKVPNLRAICDDTKSELKGPYPSGTRSVRVCTTKFSGVFHGAKSHGRSETAGDKVEVGSDIVCTHVALFANASKSALINNWKLWPFIQLINFKVALRMCVADEG